jgi:hypothetical protein
MTKRAFWDRYGNLWEEPDRSGVMTLLWNGESEDLDGMIDGWWKEPCWLVERFRGPLVGAA